MPFLYRFGRLTLTSDFAVSGLRRLRGVEGTVADITLSAERAAAPAAERIVFAWRGRYAMRLGTIGGDWLIDSALDGVFRLDRGLRRLWVYSAQRPPSAAAIDVLVRRVLPRMLAGRGATTLHAAAATAPGGKSVLLLGRSGAGKSTTAAALAIRPDWDVFSDDLSVLWDDVPPVAAPSATGVCLWEASRAGLGIDPALCHAMPGYDGKFRFEPPVAAKTDPAPLSAMVFLSRETDIDRPELSAMPRPEALVDALRQLILFDPSDREEHAAAAARLNRIFGALEVVRLRYPPRFDALPAVADAIGTLLNA